MTSPSYNQLGNSATAANNTVLKNNDDGTFSIQFGNAGSATDEVKVNADGSLLLGSTKTIPSTVAGTVLINQLGSDVALNNTGLYFTGPSVAQGTSGTWFASGTVTVTDSAGAAVFLAKLWDGTSVIASTAIKTSGAAVTGSLSLSGFITSPAGNIRISVQDVSSTSGFINYAAVVSGKDSSVTVLRVA